MTIFQGAGISPSKIAQLLMQHGFQGADILAFGQTGIPANFLAGYFLTIFKLGIDTHDTSARLMLYLRKLRSATNE